MKRLAHLLLAVLLLALTVPARALVTDMNVTWLGSYDGVVKFSANRAFRVYTPDNTAEPLRAVLFFWSGSGSDYRGQAQNQSFQAVADALGLVLVGMDNGMGPMDTDTAAAAEIRWDFDRTLAVIAARLGRPAIAGLPHMHTGFSLGSWSSAYNGLTASERTVAYAPLHGGGIPFFANVAEVVQPALKVPGLFIPGSNDSQASGTQPYTVEVAADELRGKSYPVSFSAVRFAGHTTSGPEYELGIYFMWQTYLARLSRAAGGVAPVVDGFVALPMIPLNEGWLGGPNEHYSAAITSQTSSAFPEIAPAPSYTGATADASWLPNQAAAYAWRANAAWDRQPAASTYNTGNLLLYPANSYRNGPLLITGLPAFSIFEEGDEVGFTVEPRYFGNTAAITRMDCYVDGDLAASDTTAADGWRFRLAGLTRGYRGLVVVASRADGQKTSCFRAIVMKGAGSVHFLASQLPEAQVRQSYTASLAVRGGVAPYTFSLAGGALPTGVKLVGSQLTGVPYTAGSFSVSVKVRDSSVPAVELTQSFTLNVAASNTATAFQEASGLLVIEAENYDAASTVNGRTWTVQSNATADAGQCITALPDTGGAYTTTYTTAAPRADYRVRFARAGVYQVWARMKAPAGAAYVGGKSIHFGLNGSPQPEADNHNLVPDVQATADYLGNFLYQATSDFAQARVRIPGPGLYTLNLWMGEDGVGVDKIILAEGGAYFPSGSPAQSARVTTGANPPSVAITAPATGASANSGAAVTFTGTASDPEDGDVAAYAWWTSSFDGVFGSGANVTTSLLRSGPHKITFAAVDSAGNTSSTSIALTVNGGSVAFRQDSTADGVLSMEAESYATSMPGTGTYAGKTWQQLSDAGASGGLYHIANPNTGTTITTASTAAPALNYSAEFVTTGTHYVWLRMRAPGAVDDSVYLALDGTFAGTLNDLPESTTWIWARHPQTLNIATTGFHTFTLSMREDGLEVDKIVITKNTGATYLSGTGTGPAETRVPSNPPTYYAAWLTARGLPAGTAFNADPDGNGLAAGLEYALNLPATGAAIALLPRMETLADGRPSYVFDRQPARVNASYIIESSADLAAWTQVAWCPAASAGFVNLAPANYEVSEDQTVAATPRVRITPRVGLVPSVRFFRLVVAQDSP